MFEVNADGHAPGAPRDAFFKSGGGGFGICVVPSLDLVIYKMAGDDRQYDPKLTGIPQDYPYDGSRDHWKPAAKSQFSDGPIGTDDGLTVGARRQRIRRKGVDRSQSGRSRF